LGKLIEGRKGKAKTKKAFFKLKSRYLDKLMFRHRKVSGIAEFIQPERSWWGKTSFKF